MGLLYLFLVRLHPPAFRRQFGDEMELIYEESGRPLRLLGDMFISIIRQWLFRSRIWIFALAGIGGTIPFALGLGFLSVARSWFGMPPHVRRIHAIAAGGVVRGVSQPLTEPFLMLTSTIAVMFISGTMILTISWFSYAQRRRYAQRQRQA